MTLNYKNIPYTTEWLEYPDIASRHISAGISPNVEGMPYTIPAIKLPDGQCMQNSKRIAAELDVLYPEPSLHLDTPVLAKLKAVLPRIMIALGPVIFPSIARQVLTERSAEYFHETRSKRFGMSLEEYEKCDKGGEVAWESAQWPIGEAAELLKQDNSGPFFLGKEGASARLEGSAADFGAC